MPATPIASLTSSCGNSSSHRRPSGLELRRRRRVAVQVALGQPNRADVEARREAARRELGRAAADVEERASRPLARRRRGASAALPRRLSRSFVEKPYDHSISPRNASPFSASRTALVATASVRSAPSVSSSRRKSARTLRTRATGTGSRPPAGVDAFAEARDDAPAHDLIDAAFLDVGDEEASRIRAEVDRRDARHLRGTAPRSPSTERLTSPAAARSTASRASEACRRSAARVSRSAVIGERRRVRLRLRGRAQHALQRRVRSAGQRLDAAPQTQPAQGQNDAGADDRDDQEEQGKQGQQRDCGMVTVLLLRPRRGVEQSGSSPGS